MSRIKMFCCRSTLFLVLIISYKAYGADSKIETSHDPKDTTENENGNDSLEPIDESKSSSMVTVPTVASGSTGEAKMVDTTMPIVVVSPIPTNELKASMAPTSSGATKTKGATMTADPTKPTITNLKEETKIATTSTKPTEINSPISLEVPKSTLVTDSPVTINSTEATNKPTENYHKQEIKYAEKFEKLLELSKNYTESKLTQQAEDFKTFKTKFNNAWNQLLAKTNELTNKIDTLMQSNKSVTNEKYDGDIQDSIKQPTPTVDTTIATMISSIAGNTSLDSMHMHLLKSMSEIQVTMSNDKIEMERMKQQTTARIAMLVGLVVVMFVVILLLIVFLCLM